MFGQKEKATQQLKQTIQPEEINQKVLVKEEKRKRYRDRTKQYRQKVHSRITKENSTSTYTWGHTINGIQRKQNNFGAKYGNGENIAEADWIKNVKKELKGLEKDPKAKLQQDSPRATLKKVPNWKTLGHDGIHGFRFWKKITSIHDRLAIEMNRCLDETNIPEWMIKGNTTLIQKDLQRETASNNYRPMTCLQMIWKILTSQIREEICNSLISRRLFPEKQKGYNNRIRRTGDQHIDQHFLKESGTRRKNLWRGLTTKDI